MHAAQANDFIGACGHNHVLSPIGYNKYLKTVVCGSPVRSAVEQHAVHTLATHFLSNVIRIPAVFDTVNHSSYIMEHMPCGTFVNPTHYKLDMRLMRELNRFFHFMMCEGYFPYNFTLLAYPDGTYAFLDFSQFGDFSEGAVKLKHLKQPISLIDAERAYGLLSFFGESNSIGNPEKIEVCDAEEEVDGVTTEYIQLDFPI